MFLLANRICLIFVFLAHIFHAKNLSSHEANMNTTDSFVLVSSTVLTKLQISNNNNSSQDGSNPKSTQKNYLDDIFQKLEEVKASKCEYGSNPKIAEICSEFSQALEIVTPTQRNELNELTLKDIEHLIISRKIVKDLKHKCLNGQWCLDDVNSNEKPFDPIGAKLIQEHSFELCLFASCFSKISAYINHCVSNVTRSVLNIAPILCELSNNGQSKNYCLEPSLRLIHASVAPHYETNTNKTSICQENIKTKGICQDECKLVALEFRKLESCCRNSSLINRFNLLNWYSDYSDQVEKSCHLPYRSSLCWSDGKYYIGIGPEMIMIAIVVTMISTLVIVLFFYVVCCRKTIKVQQPFTDMYEYSQLNQEVEEEMNMNTRDDDEYGYVNKKHQYEMDKNNKDISRFVNQHQTDIKGLLMG